MADQQELGSDDGPKGCCRDQAGIAREAESRMPFQPCLQVHTATPDGHDAIPATLVEVERST